MLFLLWTGNPGIDEWFNDDMGSDYSGDDMEESENVQEDVDEEEDNEFVDRKSVV